MGVFVNEDIENIAHLVKNKIIDIVQLHGNEDESYINTLKAKISVPMIYAYQIKSKTDIKSVKNDTEFILREQAVERPLMKHYLKALIMNIF